MEERCKLSSGVRIRAPTANAFLHILSFQNAFHRGDIFIVYLECKCLLSVF